MKNGLKIKLLACLTFYSVILGRAEDITELYLQGNDDSELHVSGTIDILDTDRDNIFLKTLIVARELEEKSDISIENIDFSQRTLCLYKEIDNGMGGNKLLDKKKALYKFKILLSPPDNSLLNFEITDILVTYKERGVLQKTLPLSKLKSEKKKQIDFEGEFLKLITEFLSDYLNQMEPVKCPTVDNWDNLSKGKVVKGMTPPEVELIIGKPPYTNQNNNRIKWMYSNNYVIIFTDGKVTSIIE